MAKSSRTISTILIKTSGRVVLKRLNIAFFLSTFVYLNLSYLLLNNQYTTTRPLVGIPPENTISPLPQLIHPPPNPRIYQNVSMLLWPRIPKTGGKDSLTLLKLLIPRRNIIVNSWSGSAYNEDKRNYSVVPHEKNDLEIIPEHYLQSYFHNLLMKSWREKLALQPNASLYVAQYHLPFRRLPDQDISSLLHKTRGTEWKFISMIRKPSDRIISSFYYIRGQSKGRRSFETDYMTLYVPQIIKMQRNYTVDECAQSYDDGENVCHFSTNYYVKWFCGGDTLVCDPLNINEDSYNRAIQNIDAYFSWIGVLEYYKESLYALYHGFPLFFQHLKDSTAFEKSFEKYQSILSNLREKSRNGNTYHEKKPSEESVAILNRKNAFDWKLYEYVVWKYGYRGVVGSE